MEAVRSVHEVEISRACVLECDTHALSVLVESHNAVTENGLTVAFDPLVDDLGQFTAKYAHIAAECRRAKHFGIEASDSSAIRVDERSSLISSLLSKIIVSWTG